MKTMGMTEVLLDWIRKSQPLLDANRVTVRLPSKIIEGVLYADFSADFAEATVQIWENGFSDFHVADTQADEVQVTHHEFRGAEEFSEALRELILRMGQHSLSSQERIFQE